MELNELDGFYQFTFSINPMPEGFYSNTVAHLVLSNGRFTGIARGGSRWSGVFRLVGDEASFDAVISPQEADENIRVFDDQGNMTRNSISFSDARMAIIQSGDDLMLDGTIVKGPTRYHVVGKRLRGVNG